MAETREIPRVFPVKCTTAYQLLGALAPNGQIFREFDPGEEYVYRGHASSDWQLIPSAFREGAYLKTHHGWGKRAPTWVNSYQIEAEVETLGEFFQLADRHGLPIPEDSQVTRNMLDLKEEFVECRAVWPPMELLSFIALAQHFGVATRLLDWSRSAYIAAYFAVSGAIKKLARGGTTPEDMRRVEVIMKPSDKPDMGTLSIWAFSKMALDIDRKMRPLILESTPKEQRPEHLELHRSVELVTAPAATNANLRAQSGLFTLSRPKVMVPLSEVSVRPLDEEIDESILKFGNHAVFLHFTLPVVEACRMLKLLSREGVTAASVFPGFAGVAETLNERAWYPMTSLRP